MRDHDIFNDSKRESLTVHEASQFQVGIVLVIPEMASTRISLCSTLIPFFENLE